MTRYSCVDDDHADALGGEEAHGEDDALHGSHAHDCCCVVWEDDGVDDLGTHSHAHPEHHCHVEVNHVDEVVAMVCDELDGVLVMVLVELDVEEVVTAFFHGVHPE